MRRSSAVRRLLCTGAELEQDEPQEKKGNLSMKVETMNPNESLEIQSEKKESHLSGETDTVSRGWGKGRKREKMRKSKRPQRKRLAAV